MASCFKPVHAADTPDRAEDAHAPDRADVPADASVLALAADPEGDNAPPFPALLGRRDGSGVRRRRSCESGGAGLGWGPMGDARCCSCCSRRCSALIGGVTAGLKAGAGDLSGEVIGDGAALVLRSVVACAWARPAGEC